MDAKWSDDDESYVVSDPVLGDFYGATPSQAHAAYLEALRVAGDHARKNPQEARHVEPARPRRLA
jgi:hypothetical protein